MVSRVDNVMGMALNDDAEEVTFANAESGTPNPYLFYSADEANAVQNSSVGSAVEEKKKKRPSGTGNSSSNGGGSSAGREQSSSSSRPKSASKKR